LVNGNQVGSGGGVIVNIEDLFAKKIRLSTPLFLMLVIIMLLAWSYLLGAGERAGTVAYFVFALSLFIAFGYPLWVMRRYLLSLRVAKRLYQQHLDALSKKELMQLLKHEALRPNSLRMVQDTGQRRFPAKKEVL